MKKITVLLCFLLAAGIASKGDAFWIWSTKKKKWRNPAYSSLASPQAQLEKAMKLYNNADYKEAVKEFRKLVLHFPDAKEAPDAQYYVGKCLESLNRPYEAFREYQRVISSYPYSVRIKDIISIEYKIGEYFLSKEKKKWLGVSVDDLFEHPSIEIFQKIIENAPYSEEAKASQYKLGLLYKSLGRYKEAIDTLKDLIEKYPESRWVEPARYQLAIASAKASLGAEYDQELTIEAKKRFSEFVSSHPEAELSSQAYKELDKLKDKEATRYFKIAEFYDKQKNYKSAKIYYHYIIDNYPGTSYQQEAKKRVSVIEGGKN